jgi:hypothetical protein
VATHDYVISNGTGSAVRSDLNGALAAIVSQNSNASAPATTYAYMSWADTSAGVMKMRNGANSAWISLYELDGTFLASDISLAAGSAAAPSLFFTGDTNTGLFSPGADTVALATAGQNRLHVSSGGLVGIGTTPDSYSKLHVSNSGAEGFEFQPGTVTANVNTIFSYKRSTSAYISLDFLALNHVFRNSGGEAARIDNSGRLLVGTSSSPSAGNGQYALAVIQGTAGTPGGAGSFSLQRGEGAANITSGEGIAYVNFNDNNGNTFGTFACEADANAGASDFPGRLVFSTTADGAASPTERMRISSKNDLVGISPVADTHGLIVFNQSTAGTTWANFIGKFGSTSAYTGGTNSIFIWSNGNVQNTNNSYTGISDIKLKENIVDAASQWSDLKALQVRKYNFKEGQTHTQIGLIAQEVELVSPGLVNESPDRDAEGNDLGTVTKGVNYSVLYMKAVKALQEAMERIETLEARLTAAGIE